MNTETWYSIEYSRKGADDWFESASFDTRDAADKELRRKQSFQDASIEYRLVRKTLITETVD